MINKNFEQGGAYNAPEAKLLNVKTESVLLNGSVTYGGASLNGLSVKELESDGWEE